MCPIVGRDVQLTHKVGAPPWTEWKIEPELHPEQREKSSEKFFYIS